MRWINHQPSSWRFASRRNGVPLSHSMFDVRRSMFDVGCWMFPRFSAPPPVHHRPVCGTTVEAFRGQTAWPRGAASHPQPSTINSQLIHQPQFQPAYRLHMVVAGGGHFCVFLPDFSFSPVSFVCLFGQKSGQIPLKLGLFVCRKPFKKTLKKS